MHTRYYTKITSYVIIYVWISMVKDEIDKKTLPDEPGVYFFKKGRRILYIGKATSLRSRVRSYFRDDLDETRSPLIRQMVNDATNLTWQVTDSVLEALVLEAHLIKQYQPPYNTREKDNKSFHYVVITGERWPRLVTVRGHDLAKLRSGEIEPVTTAGGKPSRSRSAMTILSRTPIKKVFGPFTSGSALEEALKLIRKIFPYRDRKCTPADEQSGAPKPCFNYQIGLCPGVCVNSIERREYLRLIRNITLFFEGRKSKLLNTLTKEMDQAAKRQEFEHAADLRKAIYALNHINDVALLKRDLLDEPDQADNAAYRIEAYDVAHLAGEALVGVMTAVVNGEVSTDAYRKFSIRSGIGVDDTGALQEVLHRRLKHTEWPYPDLIVVDGAKAQKNAAERTLREQGVQIPVVAVTKDERHKPREILASTDRLVNDHKQSILLANSEAHRFAIEYHRKQMRGR